MMRKTAGNMMNNTDNNLEDPLYDPIQVYKNENKTKQKCIIAIWTLTNVVTFMFGYYVKTAFNDDDCSVEMNGSL